jgi:hypothetical protein
MTSDDGPHLTPDLPPGTEAPSLRGEVRPHPEESRIGRSAPLPIPSGTDRGDAAPRLSGRRGTANRSPRISHGTAPGSGRRRNPPPAAHR